MNYQNHIRGGQIIHIHTHNKQMETNIFWPWPNKKNCNISNSILLTTTQKHIHKTDIHEELKTRYDRHSFHYKVCAVVVMIVCVQQVVVRRQQQR